MVEQATDDSDREQKHDDRFGMTLRRGDDRIKLKRSPVADECEVVAEIGDSVYRTTHAREAEAQERVAILVLMDKRGAEFEEGDDVFVVSDGFTPVVQRGVVARNQEQYQSIDVRFLTDPFDDESVEQRTIGCDPSELLHAHAGPVELLQFIGRDDLLEWEDFVTGEDVTYDA